MALLTYAPCAAATPVLNFLTMTAPKFIQECRTDTERRFFPYLEAFCLERGFKLELDYQIGPYFPDFAIPSQKLIIEIDGPSHDRHSRMAKDIKRNSYIRKRGWVTLRFSNHQATNHPSECIQLVAAFLASNLILSA